MDQTTSTHSCSKIYNSCLHLLKVTVSACSTINQKPKDIFMLKQSWGRLVLWDEVFKDQNLDETLNKSPIVRDTVLRLFYGIGATLLKGKLLILFANSRTNSSSHSDVIPLVLSRSKAQGGGLQDLADKITTELQEAIMVPREYYEMESSDAQKENRDWDELETNRNPPQTLSTAAETVSFYVLHLLSLQPTIESLLRFCLCNGALNDDAHNSTGLALSSVPPYGEITHERDHNDYEFPDGREGDSPTITISPTQYSQPEVGLENRSEASETIPRAPDLGHPQRPVLATHSSKPLTPQFPRSPNSPFMVVSDSVLSNTQSQMPQRCSSFCGNLEGMECSSPLVMVHNMP